MHKQGSLDEAVRRPKLKDLFVEQHRFYMRWYRFELSWSFSDYGIHLLAAALKSLQKVLNGRPWQMKRLGYASYASNGCFELCKRAIPLVDNLQLGLLV